MALRTFLASDGTRWSVWYVESKTLREASGTPRAWLAFIDEQGSERRRLFEVPPNWESLPAERLDLLRRIATSAPAREPVKAPAAVNHTRPLTEATSAAGDRSFRDRDGVQWEVSEIKPTFAERRSQSDRRRVARSGPDRRRAAGARVRMREPFQHGWLVFRSVTEQRRRAPIPSGWIELSDEALRNLLAEATAIDSPRRTG